MFVEVVADELAVPPRRVQPALVMLDARPEQLLERHRNVADVVVARDLVPVAHREPNSPVRLSLADVEPQALVPLWVERVADDARAEDLLAKRDDAERVHVVARP